MKKCFELSTFQLWEGGHAALHYSMFLKQEAMVVALDPRSITVVTFS